MFVSGEARSRYTPARDSNGMPVGYPVEDADEWRLPVDDGGAGLGFLARARRRRREVPPEQREEQPHGRHAPSMSERLLEKTRPAGRAV